MSKATRVGEFKKVKFSRFHEDVKDILGGEKEEHEQVYRNLELPSRATGGSAGYDFKAPFFFCLGPGESITIPTGVRVKIDEGWFLMCVPKSGLDTKYRVQLDNTVGVIDSDYYYSDNEGHIFARLTNDSKEGKVLRIDEGQKFMQAVFVPYGITYSDKVKTIRNGGFGSTGK